MVRVLGALLLTTAMACAGAPAVAQRTDPPARSAYARSVLTQDGPRLQYRSGAGGRVVISGAATDTGHPDLNRREVFSRPGASAARDQTTCATWVRQSDVAAQQGLAVRIRDNAGRVRAVTLTKNVEFRIYWVFNLLTWDTARAGDPWRSVGQFDMSPVIGQSADRLTPFPWRVCLRATGRTLAFKVWLPAERAQPSWRNDHYVRRARLPRGYSVGVPGWYVGHLAPGARVVYGNLTTR